MLTIFKSSDSVLPESHTNKKIDTDAVDIGIAIHLFNLVFLVFIDSSFLLYDAKNFMKILYFCSFFEELLVFLS